MPIGESGWLKEKVPVKFIRYSTGGLFHKSGLYFMTGPYRFRVTRRKLEELLKKEKAFLIVDKETIRGLAMKYQGKEKKKEQPQVDPKVVKLHEYKQRKEEAARKAAEDAARRRDIAEKRKRIAEKAKKKFDMARK